MDLCCIKPVLNLQMAINTTGHCVWACDLSVTFHSNFVYSVNVPMLSLSLSAQVRLIDAGFLWTEPHSKRIKIKVTIQKEVRKTVNAITVGEWHSNWTGEVSLNIVLCVSTLPSDVCLREVRFSEFVISSPWPLGRTWALNSFVWAFGGCSSQVCYIKKTKQLIYEHFFCSSKRWMTCCSNR